MSSDHASETKAKRKPARSLGKSPETGMRVLEPSPKKLVSSKAKIRRAVAIVKARAAG